MRNIISFIGAALLAVALGCGSNDAQDCDAVSVLSGNAACSSQIAPTRLSLGNPDGHDDDPTLIHAQDGHYYLAYLSDVSGNKEIWITRSSDGASWSTPLKITNHSDEDIYPNLVQTADGTFHLLWQRLVTATGESHVYYRRTTDALSWGGSETAVTSGVTDDTEPMLAVSGSSDFRVYFSSAQRSTALGKPAYNRDIYMVRSQDGGTSWASPVIVTLIAPGSDNSWDRFPWMIRKDTNDFHLVFQRQNTSTLLDATSDLMISSSTDGLTWPAPTQITSDAGDSEYDLFPNLFFAPLLGKWTISWLTTHWNTSEGELANLPLDQSGNYPAAAFNLSSVVGMGGWSTRVATGSSNLSLMVWVSSKTGQPQLWSAMLRL